MNATAHLAERKVGNGHILEDDIEFARASEELLTYP